MLRFSRLGLRSPKQRHRVRNYAEQDAIDHDFRLFYRPIGSHLCTVHAGYLSDRSARLVGLVDTSAACCFILHIARASTKI